MIVSVNIRGAFMRCKSNAFGFHLPFHSLVFGEFVWLLPKQLKSVLLLRLFIAPVSSGVKAQAGRAHLIPLFFGLLIGQPKATPG